MPPSLSISAVRRGLARAREVSSRSAASPADECRPGGRRCRLAPEVLDEATDLLLLELIHHGGAELVAVLVELGPVRLGATRRDGR
jgi:hypothetical protein